MARFQCAFNEGVPFLMLNMDLSQSVVVETAAMPWSGSRADGVVRKPHLSQHTPWVEQETLIYVKTGHL